MRSAKLLALAAATVLLVSAGAARAASPPAIDEYVESVPTADGSTGSGTGSSTGSATAAHPARTAISRTAARAVERSGGPDKQVLEQVATSARYGAPTKRLAHAAPHSSRPTPAPSAVGAFAAAVSGGGSSRIGWLALVLGLTALATAAAKLLGRSARRAG